MKQLFSFILITSLLAACNGDSDKAAEAEKAKQHTIDSLNTVMSKQKTIDSMKMVAVRNEQKTTHVVETTTMENSSAQPAKKKGWSHTAKGAVVGAGTGAVTGAIINHNDRAKGAVIGTLIGAGVGAGTGLIVDKSVQNKKKKAAAAKTN
ncbi:MAG: glycine zipper family protein [Chitinophagaceae bacterium]